MFHNVISPSHRRARSIRVSKLPSLIIEKHRMENLAGLFAALSFQLPELLRGVSFLHGRKASTRREILSFRFLRLRDERSRKSKELAIRRSYLRSTMAAEKEAEGETRREREREDRNDAMPPVLLAPSAFSSERGARHRRELIAGYERTYDTHCFEL